MFEEIEADERGEEDSVRQPEREEGVRMNGQHLAHGQAHGIADREQPDRPPLESGLRTCRLSARRRRRFRTGLFAHALHPNTTGAATCSAPQPGRRAKIRTILLRWHRQTLPAR